MSEHELIALEDQGWQALSSNGEAAAAFYDRILDDTVVMLLPGGMTLDDRATIISAMSGQPWSSYDLEEPQVLQPTPDTCVVYYGVVATRDEVEYSALVSSGYALRNCEWRMTFHQQTPR